MTKKHKPLPVVETGNGSEALFLHAEIVASVLHFITDVHNKQGGAQVFIPSLGQARWGV